MNRVWRRLFSACLPILLVSMAAGAEPLRIATFEIDVTPPLGSPLAYGRYPAAVRIDTPLFARGIVLLGEGEPIVLCAVDFEGIGNSGMDTWRETLAEAAGTTIARVDVHAVHQKDAPGCDLAVEGLLAELGMSGKCCDIPFLKDVFYRVDESIRKSLQNARPVTHLGTGQAIVERVASTRRVMNNDGTFKFYRASVASKPDDMVAAEGLIDPQLKLLSFWNEDTPLVSITYYAVHPNSYYGAGQVNADFVGLARAARERTLPNVFHVHFTGAGGNLGPGKYNDGSPKARVELAERTELGMKQAWEITQRVPITSNDIEWRVQPVILPLSEALQNLDNADQKLMNDTLRPADRIKAARDIEYVERVKEGKTISLASLRLGPAVILSLPSEIFVEYQLAAQKMRPDLFVCTAAYGDIGPGYICTAIAYSEGGYEAGEVGRTGPGAEEILMDSIKKLLR